MDFNKLIARVKNILLTPKTEWPVIAAEPDTVPGIFTNYIVILAAIPAVVQFLKLSIIGISIPIVGGSIRMGIGTGITQMIVVYIVSLAVCYLMMLIIDALAPTFGGEKNQVQALKSFAYAYTPAWVVSVLGLLGLLGSLAGLAAAIYGIYLLYLGLPHTMKCPQEKAGGYAAATIIIGFVLSLVLGAVLASVTGFSGAMTGAMSGGLNTSSTYTPDKNSALGTLAAIGQQAEAASKKMEAAQKSGDANAQAAAAGQMLGAVLGGGSQVEALAPDALKPFVPETLAGLPRTSLSVQKQAPLGMQVSIAEARYGSGNGPSYELTVTDSGSAKGFMALAGFGAMENEEQTDHGYEKTYHQDGRLVHEQWNQSGDGEYTVVLGDRFIVNVKGSHVANIDALKSALGGLNLAGLEALKSQGVKNG
ncbi:MAG: Yip1 family protein [Rudaea sp.]|uniref:Yip1 family protein n=1 Tax=Rudaea sp. TaxID=2136325 RepID=UPI0039E458F3